MKPTNLFTLAAVICIVVSAGCDRSQDIPENASYLDPTGVNAKNAPAEGTGPTAEQQATSQKVGDRAAAFGQEMNQKYGNR